MNISCYWLVGVCLKISTSDKHEKQSYLSSFICITIFNGVITNTKTSTGNVPSDRLNELS